MINPYVSSQKMQRKVPSFSSALTWMTTLVLCGQIMPTSLCSQQTLEALSTIDVIVF